jgi:hypothetical protein
MDTRQLLEYDSQDEADLSEGERAGVDGIG